MNFTFNYFYVSTFEGAHKYNYFVKFKNTKITEKNI